MAQGAVIAVVVQPFFTRKSSVLSVSKELFKLKHFYVSQENRTKDVYYVKIIINNFEEVFYNFKEISNFEDEIVPDVNFIIVKKRYMNDYTDFILIDEAGEVYGEFLNANFNNNLFFFKTLKSILYKRILIKNSTNYLEN